MTRPTPGSEPAAPGPSTAPPRPLPERRPSRRPGAGPAPVGGGGTVPDEAVRLTEQIETAGALAGAPEATVG